MESERNKRNFENKNRNSRNDSTSITGGKLQIIRPPSMDM
jgi:hypothetical protein